MAELKRLLPNLIPARRYSVRIKAISGIGISSPWSEALEFVTPQDESVPNAPTNLDIDFTTPTLVLGWDRPDYNTNGSVITDFSHYRVTLTALGTSRTYETNQAFFSYGLSQNIHDFGIPQPNIHVAVRAVDFSGHASQPLTGTAVNPAPKTPPAPTGNESFGFLTLLMKAHPDDSDIKEFVVERSEEPDANFFQVGVTTGDAFIDVVEGVATYYYRVRARDFFNQTSQPSPVLGLTSIANPSMDVTPPQAVQDFIIADIGLDLSGVPYVDLAWSPNNVDADLAYFHLRVLKVEDGSVHSHMIGPGASSFRASNLDEDSEYKFIIYAYDHAGNRSAPSIELTAFTLVDESIPDTPTLPTPSTYSGYNSISVLWNPVSSSRLSHYEVYASTTQGFNADTVNFNNRTFVGNASRYVQNAGTGETWYFRVRAVGINGQASPFTPEFSGTSQSGLDLDGNPPGIVDSDGHNLVSGIYINQANRYETYIDWDWPDLADSDLHYYEIRYSTASSTGPWSYVQTPESSFRFTNLNPGTLVYLGVRGVDMLGNAQPIWTEKFITTQQDDTPPDAPVISANDSVVVGADFRVQWTHDAPVDFRHYKVRVFPAGSPGNSVNYFTTDKRFTYTFAQNRAAFVTPSASLTFEVSAVDIAGNESDTDSITLENQAPGTFIVTPVSGSIVTLKWTLPSGGDIEKYTVHRRSTGTTIWTELATVFSRQYIDAPSEGNYDYYVIAFDVYGQSRISNTVGNVSVSAAFIPDTTPPPVPEQSVGFPQTGFDNEFGSRAWVDQQWEAIDDFDEDFSHYKVEIAGPTGMVSSSTTTSTLIRFGDLLTNTTYTIKTSSVDIFGNTSEPLVSSILTIVDTIPPPKVENLTASGGINTIGLVWEPSPAADVAFYELHEGDIDDFEPSISNRVYKGLGTSAAFSREAGVTKWYQVSATDLAGNQSEFSDIAYATAFGQYAGDEEPPSNVTNLQVTGAPYFHGSTEYARIDATWNQATDNIAVGHYILRIREGTGAWTEVVVGSNRYTFYELIPGVQYGFQVKAVDTAGNRSALWSAPEVLYTVTSEAPTTPSDVVWPTTGDVEALSVGGVKFTWNPVTNVQIRDYEVVTATNSTFTANVRTHYISGTYITITGTPGVTYYARVKARSLYGLTSANWSESRFGVAKKLVTDDIEVIDLSNSDIFVNRLSATSIIVSGDTTFPDANYDPSTKATPQDVIDAENAAKLHAENEASTALSEANSYTDSAIEGTITTYFQETEPEGAKAGDLWVDTLNNKLKVYNDGQWVEVQDSDLTQAIIDLQDLEAAVDGKITSYYQNTEPVGGDYSIGDLWFNMSNGNEPHVWDGTEWKTLTYIEQIAIEKANAAQAAAITHGEAYADDASALAAQSIDEAIRGDFTGTATGTTIDGARIQTGTIDAELLVSSIAIINGLRVQSLFQINAGGTIESTNFHATNKTGFRLTDTAMQMYQGSIVLGGSGLNINTETNRMWYGSTWDGAAWRVDGTGNMRVGTADTRFNVLNSGELRIGANTTTAPTRITNTGLAEFRNIRIMTTELGTPTSTTDILNIGDKFIIRRLAGTTTDEFRVAGDMFLDANANLRLNGGSITLTSGDMTLSGGNITVSSGSIRSSAAYNGTQATGYSLGSDGILRASGAVISGEINVTGGNVHDIATGVVEEVEEGIRLDFTGSTTGTKITGTGIATGSITANDAVFGAAAIQSADINSLVANKIETGTLTASVGIGTTGVIFTGASPSSGSRVVMTPSGLFGFNNSNEEQFGIDASTGAARFAGSLQAASGSFTGNLTGSSMELSGNLNVLGEISSNNNGVRITSTGLTMTQGQIDINNGAFRVTTDGELTATSASITGAITATSGSFTGQITINSGGSLVAGNTTLSSTGLVMNQGSINIGSGAFVVTASGAVTMKNAVITGEDMVAGSRVIDTPAFNVTKEGKVTATDLNATGGQIGSTTITDTEFVSGTIRGSDFEIDNAGGISFTGDGDITWGAGANGKIIVSNSGEIRSSANLNEGGWSLGPTGLQLGEGSISASTIDIRVSSENLLTNSAFTYGTGIATGWAAIGTPTFSISEDAGGFLFFGKSQKIVANATATIGIRQDVTPQGGFAANEPIMASVWMKNIHATARSGRIIIQTTGGTNLWVGNDFNLSANTWVRVTAHHRLANAQPNGLRIALEVRNATSGQTFYMDGAKVERSDFITDYAPRSLEIPQNYIQSVMISNLEADKIVAGNGIITNLEIKSGGSVFGNNWSIGQNGANFANGTISLAGAGGATILDSESLRSIIGGTTKFLVNGTGVYIGGSDANSASVYFQGNKSVFRSNASGIDFRIDSNPDLEPSSWPNLPDVRKVLSLKQGSTDAFYLTEDGQAYFLSGVINGGTIMEDTITALHIQTDTIAADAAFMNSLVVYDANINTLSADKLTSGTIDANEISVINLDAGNITAGTIGGARIADGSLSAVKFTSSLQSDNYVAGSTGWRINRSTGDVEFSTGTFRGSIVIGGKAATTYISDEISPVDTKATNAQTTANSASSTANSAQTTANTANTNALASRNPINWNAGSIASGINIRSSNFDVNNPSTSLGWGIYGNGNAYFNNVQIRGSSVVGGEITIGTGIWPFRVQSGIYGGQTMTHSINGMTADFTTIVADNLQAVYWMTCHGPFTVNGASDLRGGFVQANRVYANNSTNVTTNTTQRVVIDYNGGYGIFRRTGDQLLYLNRSNTGDMMTFLTGSTTRGRIETTSGTVYHTSSDYRLKEAIGPVPDALDRLNQLTPRRYYWKEFGPDSEPEDGFFVHEVEDIVPAATSGEKDAVDDEGNMVPQMMDHSRLVPLLVAAVQELSAKVEELTKE